MLTLYLLEFCSNFYCFIRHLHCSYSYIFSIFEAIKFSSILGSVDYVYLKVVKINSSKIKHVRGACFKLMLFLDTGNYLLVDTI